MTDPVVFDQKDETSSLGPHYFSAQKFADKLVASEDWDTLRQPVNKIAEDFCNKVKSVFEDSLKDEFESVIQTYVWRTVDEVVRAILGNKQWPSDRYVLGDRYNC